MISSRWPDLGRSPRGYRAAVLEVLDSGVLTEGEQTTRLETAVADFLRVGARQVSALNGGTQSIEALLYAMGVGPGWRVGVPALTFAGSAIPVLRRGAQIVWVDVDPRTYNISPRTVREAGLDPEDERTVLIAVDLHGLPAPFPDLREDGWRERVLEDACQAWGARLRDAAAGTLADFAAFSLNRTKTVQGGEGGIAICPPELTARVRAFRKFGIADADAGGGVAYEPGGNYKITELSSAVARVSLSELPLRVRRATKVAGILGDACRASGLLEPPYVPEDAAPSWHKFRVRARDRAQRDALYRRLTEAGVPVCFWQALPLSLHPAFPVGPYVRWEASEAFRALAETFLIGTEDQPLCVWTLEEAAKVAEVIGNLSPADAGAMPKEAMT